MRDDPPDTPPDADAADPLADAMIEFLRGGPVPDPPAATPTDPPAGPFIPPA